MTYWDKIQTGQHIWKPVFEEPDDTKGDDAKGNDAKDFTPDQQAKVDEMLANQKKESSKALEDAVSQLKAVQNASKMSEGDRTAMAAKIEALETANLTEAEKSRREKEKGDKKAAEALKTVETERDSWKNQFTTQTKRQALLAAATEHKAFNPEQIINELNSRTSILQGDDGSFSTQVKMPSKNKEGEAIELVLTPSEAVKLMTEDDRHLNLFQDPSSPGLGGNNQKGKNVDMDKIKSDPEAYRRARAAGAVPGIKPKT